MFLNILNIKLKQLVSLWGLCLALVACTTSNHNSLHQLEHTTLKLPEDFQDSLATSTTNPGRAENSENSAKASQPWWFGFDRPELNDLIKKTLASNLTLAQASARLEQANQTLIRTRSGLFANLDFIGGVNQSWEGSSGKDKNYDLGLSASWQPDLFKSTSRGVQAQYYETLNQLETENAVKLTLSGQVAETYFAIIATHQRLALLIRQADSDQQLEDLLQLRFEKGIGTQVDVLRQKARVLDSQKLIPLAKAEIQTLEKRLDVLLGKAPDSTNQVFNTQLISLEDSVTPEWVHVNLLMNRPDLRALKARLMAEDMQVAVAIARRLPTFNLSGSWLFEKDEDYRGPSARFAIDFVQPLLYWGRLQAEQKRAEAAFTETLALFAQNYLSAVEEVENLLIAAHARRRFLEKQQQQLQVLKEAQSQAKARYQKGLDNYLGVIDALTSVRTIEREMVTEQLELIYTEIRLHLALGSATHLSSTKISAGMHVKTN